MLARPPGAADLQTTDQLASRAPVTSSQVVEQRLLRRGHAPPGDHQRQAALLRRFHQEGGRLCAGAEDGAFLREVDNVGCAHERAVIGRSRRTAGVLDRGMARQRRLRGKKGAPPEGDGQGRK